MILPDIHLLVYAHTEASPLHAPAGEWWEGLMSRQVPVAIAWAVVFGFIRLVTHPSVLERPLAPIEALERVDGWLLQDNVLILEPGPRHLQIVRELFAATGVAASLTTDTHLAALALEHRAEVHSNDRDLGRFPGLRLRNPLE